MDLIGILVIAAISAGIGFFVAVLINNLRGPEIKVSTEETAEDEDREAVLRIWRHKETGAFLPVLKKRVCDIQAGDLQGRKCTLRQFFVLPDNRVIHLKH